MADPAKPPTHLATFTPDEVRRMILAELASIKGIDVPYGKGAMCELVVEFHDDGTLQVAATFFFARIGGPTLTVIRGGKIDGG